MTSIMVLLLAASIGLSLHLAPEKNEILVGEPLRLKLTWRADRPLQIPAEAMEGETWNHDYVQIWVDGPTGRHRYRELPTALIDQIVAADPLRAGDEVETDLTLLYGLHGMKAEGYLFPLPGTYALMLRYADNKNPADSNTVSISVSQPAGAERAILDAVKADPFDIKVSGPNAQRLAAKNPSSRYLRMARIEHYREKERRLRDRRDPETGDPLSMSQDQWDLFAADAYRRMAEDIKETDDWGPYEDVRLAMLAGYAKRGGDVEEAERAKKEVLTRFPKSRVANAIRNDEARDKLPANGDAAAWSANGVSYKVGDLVTLGDFTWKCIHSHRSQPPLSPPNAPSLWVKVLDGGS